MKGKTGSLHVANDRPRLQKTKSVIRDNSINVSTIHTLPPEG
jgi:hypothetical protein